MVAHFGWELTGWNRCHCGRGEQVSMWVEHLVVVFPDEKGLDRYLVGPAHLYNQAPSLPHDDAELYPHQ